MPRTGRIVLPGYPHHIVQRGHDGQNVFSSPRDFTYYLNELADLKETFGIRLYAYCLMPNHVHLLVSPQETASSLCQFMKALSARATRYRIRQERRSGTLWRSRYKSSLVQEDAYLLAFCRYIELNPVLAGITKLPEDYPWSSVRERLGLVESRLLDRCPAFKALGESELDRVHCYSRLISESVSSAKTSFFRGAVQRGQLTGNIRFVDEIQRLFGIRRKHRSRGRLRKKCEENEVVV
jgi:putative transposase